MPLEERGQEAQNLTDFLFFQNIFVSTIRRKESRLLPRLKVYNRNSAGVGVNRSLPCNPSCPCQQPEFSVKTRDSWRIQVHERDLREKRRHTVDDEAILCILVR